MRMMACALALGGFVGCRKEHEPPKVEMRIPFLPESVRLRWKRGLANSVFGLRALFGFRISGFQFEAVFLAFGLALQLVSGANQPRSGAATSTMTWPQFRGGQGSGVAVASNLPVHFGPTSNLLWRTPLPPGNSSPCIWSNHIFLTGYESNELQTLCLDRRDGHRLWAFRE